MKWIRKKEEKKEDKRANDEGEDILVCRSCGYKGPVSDFLQVDAGDTFCPRCNEDTNLIFEL